jgi:hypothetical protein
VRWLLRGPHTSPAAAVARAKGVLLQGPRCGGCCEGTVARQGLLLHHRGRRAAAGPCRVAVAAAPPVVHAMRGRARARAVHGAAGIVHG